MKLLRHYTAKVKGLAFIDLLTLGLVISAFMLVMAVAISYTRAAYFTKLSEIEVPVATVKSEYKRGELIEGQFFGQVFWSGQVDYTRQLICPNYVDVLPSLIDGRLIVNGKGTPRVLKGERAPIAYTPHNAPTNVNCTIQFNNHYCIPYLFGCANRDYSYYTQTFTITNDEPLNIPEPVGNSFPNVAPKQEIQTKSQSTSTEKTTNNITNNTTNTTNNSNNASGTKTETTCQPRISLLGIKIGEICTDKTSTQ